MSGLPGRDDGGRQCAKKQAQSSSGRDDQWQDPMGEHVLTLAPRVTNRGRRNAHGGVKDQPARDVVPKPTLQSYREVRALTEALARPLSGEDQTVQSMADVSPTKWHRAHVTWFFEQFVVGPNCGGYRPMDERFAYLFNSYYEGAGPRHARRQTRTAVPSRHRRGCGVSADR